MLNFFFSFSGTFYLTSASSYCPICGLALVKGTGSEDTDMKKNGLLSVPLHHVLLICPLLVHQREPGGASAGAAARQKQNLFVCSLYVLPMSASWVSSDRVQFPSPPRQAGSLVIVKCL